MNRIAPVMVTLHVVLRGYVSVYWCTAGAGGSFSGITQRLGSTQSRALSGLYANEVDAQRNDTNTRWRHGSSMVIFVCFVEPKYTRKH